MRAFVVVLDSVGIGAAPDAAEYGDEGSNTLAHLAEAVGGLRAPNLQALGLGNIPGILPAGIPIAGVPPSETPLAAYGAMRERSRGKDTTTGHWEMAGLELVDGFRLFDEAPPSFPPELISEFERRTGRSVIGNKAASGTVIIDELGPRQLETGSWIVYTSADSVFQVAAHEELITIEELYRGCTIARELCDPYLVGRVIARPYVGEAGSFSRTENRRDYSFPLPEPTLLDRLSGEGLQVVTVGKLDDIFMGRGITHARHVENNPDAEIAVLEILAEKTDGVFVFANLIDFDMLYGHRRDPQGYAEAVEQADSFLGDLVKGAGTDDLAIVTADHGNDPTFRGTDHTREYVPLLVYRAGVPGNTVGIRDGFFDLAQSVASWFGIPPMTRGRSFL